MEITNNYKINIYEKYMDLKNSGKQIQDFDNNDLWKIFEYFTCIMLSEEHKQTFYEYNDIDPSFKEQNKMSKNDTGIDACNMIDTIVQSKLRLKTLTWKECATFIASQVIFCKEKQENIIRWKKLIIARNAECKLSNNLSEKSEIFTDKQYKREDIIKYCENLISSPPKYPIIKQDEFQLRDYQIECINLITNKKKNTIISIPTGTGKNVIIIYSLKVDKKYLILVPRIILMEQIKEEIIKHKQILKNKIQMIGDNNNDFDPNKNITICVFNSVHIVEKYSGTFEKIFVDEAHHIYIPEIYINENDEGDEHNIQDKDMQDENIEDEDNEENENNENIEEDDDNNDNNDEVENVEEDNEEANDQIENNIEDDVEDELKETTNYIKIIQSFTKYNNNIYLSATIDKNENFEYYKKDIRDMIDKKYLCDYTINIPVFSNDPSNKNICEYLIANYRNIIIYCNTRKEGETINKLLNTLQKNSSEYIDCQTKRNKRNCIINKYIKGQVPFLVNVRILVEGFNANAARGVCFMHLPTKKTTLIQIMGRALRLHPLKTIANIILPFSIKEDESNITNFLKIMARNDSRIRKSYENKILGGYISLNNADNNKNIDEEENNNVEFRFEQIYNSLGVFQNYMEIWINNLEQVKKYIDQYNKKPSIRDDTKEIKFIGKWLYKQVFDLKNEEHKIKNENKLKLWIDFIHDEKYAKYFVSCEDKWKNNLEKVKKYIDINNNRPSSYDKIEENKFLGLWITTQIQNYSKKKQIMQNKQIRLLWVAFRYNIKYQKYFFTNKETWKNKLGETIKYIETNKKRPSCHSKNKDIRILSYWITKNLNNHKKKLEIMHDKEIYDLFTDFNKKYPVSKKDMVKNKLEKVKKYMDENNRRPRYTDKNEKIRELSFCLDNQLRQYKKNLIVNEETRNILDIFVNDEKYKKILNLI